MVTWALFVLVFGLNFTIWGTVGLLRLCSDHLLKARGARMKAWSHLPSHLARTRSGGTHRTNVPRRVSGTALAGLSLGGIGRVRPIARRVTCEDVAVLMAAHNEELVIEASLVALAGLVPLKNVHVVSDASVDRTVELVRAMGVHAIETASNVGKAGALSEAIERFDLLDRFEAVMILDADTQLDPRYFQVALPLFDDAKVVAVAGCAQTRWQPKKAGLVGAFLMAHRQRVYTLTQLLLKYGQTWRALNATHIVPGFASIYRTEALRHININPTGLVIEDFNMTFEIYAKGLGRVAFHPGARAYTQDPSRYQDYVRQTKRWALGLWQTVRRHRMRPCLFNIALALILLELVTSSILYLVLVPAVLLLAVPDVVTVLVSTPGVGTVHAFLAAHLSLTAVGLGVLLPDYVLTCVVALIERRPRYIVFGLFFMIMKVTDAAIAMYTLPRAWLERSTGQWVSPPRRAERSEQKVVA